MDLETLYDLVWVVQKRCEFGERLSEGDTPVDMFRFEQALIYARNQNEAVALTELPFWKDGNVKAETPLEWFEGLPEEAQKQLVHGIGEAEHIYTHVVGQYAQALAAEYGKRLMTDDGQDDPQTIGDILCQTSLIDFVAIWKDHLFETADGREMLEQLFILADHPA